MLDELFKKRDMVGDVNYDKNTWWEVGNYTGSTCLGKRGNKKKAEGGGEEEHVDYMQRVAHPRSNPWELFFTVAKMTKIKH